MICVLLAIKTYFEHLVKLSTIGNRISNLFYTKRQLSSSDNKGIYELTIEEMLTSGQYDELIAQAKDYISRITGNDEETMKEAYEFVKGQYPIEVSRKFIYELLISKLKGYQKENPKKLILN